MVSCLIFRLIGKWLVCDVVVIVEVIVWDGVGGEIVVVEVVLIGVVVVVIVGVLWGCIYVEVVVVIG